MKWNYKKMIKNIVKLNIKFLVLSGVVLIPCIITGLMYQLFNVAY